MKPSKKCAFCPNTADITGEHIWSHWINRIVPTGRMRFTWGSHTATPRTYVTALLNEKLPVVCRTCNNGWMSDLEHKHAKPAMAGLIVSDKRVLLDPERLKSIASFAFKSAVIADHVRVPDPTLGARPPFFTTQTRYAFRESLTIPDNVQMWLAAFEESRYGIFRAIYYPSPANTVPAFESYALTFGVGFLLLQVVASRLLGTGTRKFGFDVTQGEGWDKFSVPSWPADGRSVSWPPDRRLGLALANQFGNRWIGTNIDADWHDTN